MSMKTENVVPKMRREGFAKFAVKSMKDKKWFTKNKSTEPSIEEMMKMDFETNCLFFFSFLLTNENVNFMYLIDAGCVDMITFHRFVAMRQQISIAFFSPLSLRNLLSSSCFFLPMEIWWKSKSEREAGLWSHKLVWLQNISRVKCWNDERWMSRLGPQILSDVQNFFPSFLRYTKEQRRYEDRKEVNDI